MSAMSYSLSRHNVTAKITSSAARRIRGAPEAWGGGAAPGASAPKAPVPNERRRSLRDDAFHQLPPLLVPQLHRVAPEPALRELLPAPDDDAQDEVRERGGVGGTDEGVS